MEKAEAELIAVRKSKKRPATAEEIKTTRPFFSEGSGTNGTTGILFLHGFTATPSAFYDYCETIASDGYRVSAPALPGHGVTPTGLLDVTYGDWLDATLNAYDEMVSGCDRLFVVGMSLGSALALQLAVEREGICKLFLLSPAVYPIRTLKLCSVALFPIMKILGLPFWGHVAGDIKRESGFELAYEKTAINGLQQLLACMKAAQAILPRVKTNVLIFQGRTDHEIRAEKAGRLLELLGSTNKEIVWLENSYHELPRDNDADMILDRIRKEITE